MKYNIKKNKPIFFILSNIIEGNVSDIKHAKKHFRKEETKK